MNVKSMSYLVQKFLLVCVDQTLTWTNHIKAISGKMAKNIGTLRKITHLLPNSTAQH